jgi:hypothetical protein
MMNRSCNPEELHGMTVVMDTAGPTVFIGRFDQQLGDHYLLHDVDVFQDGTDGISKQAYLAKAAAFGIWVKQKDAYVSVPDVVSIRRLAEFKVGPASADTVVP